MIFFEYIYIDQFSLGREVVQQNILSAVDFCHGDF